MTENETIHKTLWELFEAVKIQANENGTKIFSTDDPKRLLIGWGCLDTGVYHYVTLISVRTRKALVLPVENEEIYSLMTELIVTKEGRVKIAAMLNSKDNSMFDTFERVLKLKAFW